MPLQNRVTPDGEIVASGARGTMMGNRGGCIHDDDRRLTGRRWVSRQWICCELTFKDRHREVMAPGRYTELFFLDEATAFAAGHRPCFECRRAEAVRFAEMWAAADGAAQRAKADDMDLVLHEERLNIDGSKRTLKAMLGELPSGAMVRLNGQAFLVQGGWLWRWMPEAYGNGLRVDPDQTVELLTPPSIVALMRRGLQPRMHPSAG